jgi:nucleotide-binding universal stress UspA family protein
MPKSILVAIDGSDSSIHALRQSFRLARAERIPIRVISVIPPFRGELRLVGVKQHVTDMLADPFRRALEVAKETAQSEGVAISTALEQGEPHEKIVEAAEEYDCDLIAMGVRGHNPAEEILMGSMTERVIGYSHTDVLVIPAGSNLGLDRMLVATDGSEAGAKATQLAFSFQRSYGSCLDILTVADVPSHLYGIAPEAAEEMIAKARQDLGEARTRSQTEGVTAEFLLLEGNPAQTITKVARDRDAHLILMGSHGRAGLKRLLMGSVTARVIGSAPCPVLVART